MRGRFLGMRDLAGELVHQVIFALAGVTCFERIVVTHSFSPFFGGRPQQFNLSGSRRPPEGGKVGRQGKAEAGLFAYRKQAR
jgi:hypothetical protein